MNLCACIYSSLLSLVTGGCYLLVVDSVSHTEIVYLVYNVNYLMYNMVGDCNT